MSDLPAVQEESKDAPEMPPGKSLVHNRVDGGEIWRLCCRIRLDMREDGLSLKDAHRALLMAYPDLEITQKDLRGFLEDYVDPAVIVEPSFYKKGLMKAAANLNTAVEISKMAQSMQDKWEEAANPDGDGEKVPLAELMTAGKKVIEARRIQAEELARVGFGPKTKQQETAVKMQPVVPVQVNAPNATFNLTEALGGSFSKRAPAPVDVDSKPA